MRWGSAFGPSGALISNSAATFNGGSMPFDGSAISLGCATESTNAAAGQSRSSRSFHDARTTQPSPAGHWSNCITRTARRNRPPTSRLTATFWKVSTSPPNATRPTPRRTQAYGDATCATSPRSDALRHSTGTSRNFVSTAWLIYGSPRQTALSITSPEMGMTRRAVAADRRPRDHAQNRPANGTAPTSVRGTPDGAAAPPRRQRRDADQSGNRPLTPWQNPVVFRNDQFQQ